MKLTRYIPISVLFEVANTSSAYVPGVGCHRAYPRRSSSNTCFRSSVDDFGGPSPRSRNSRSRHRKDDVNQAFRELQEEIRDYKKGNFDSDWVAMGMNLDPFQTMDKETVTKWIEKAFDLASEFNQDFTTPSKEREATEEMIQKSRDWVTRTYLSENQSSPDSPSFNNSETSASSDNAHDSLSTEANESRSRATSESSKIPTVAPRYENRSDEDKFEVSIDLPGVDRGDVEIAVEGDFIKIVGTRFNRDHGKPVLDYRTDIAFDETQLEMEKLEAVLKNGVLVISAPRVKPKLKKRTIEIK